MKLVDVVVVSYNSADTIRRCIEPLAHEDDIHVIVVDNASTDDSLDTIADLPGARLALDTNVGFSAGCNRGWRAGSAPYVLFLNPDTRVDAASVRQLAAVLANDSSVGLVAPRLVGGDGLLEFSRRRFPRLRSTYSRAFFLHRVLPAARWTDEVLRDPAEYERPGSVEWASGACLLVRRSALEELSGWDEAFFHYGSDIDLCRRLLSAGHEVRFEPSAQVLHVGGASAPRSDLLPMLAESRIRYARQHHSRGYAFAEQVGVALGELTHAVLSTKGKAVRTGHFRALRLACGRQPPANRSASSHSGPPAIDGTPGSN